MEKMQHSCSESWWLDHTRPYHSHWLQNTMSDLDKKMEKILEVVEDGGDTFAERAEMYYQKRPQLIQMLQQLHSSYRDLATNYDLLISRSSDSSTADFHSQSRSCPRAAAAKWGSEKLMTKNYPFELDENNYGSSDVDDEAVDVTNLQVEDDMENDKWKKLKLEVSKLMEDNLCHQKELIKRNDEKRESIKRLMNENRLLKDSLQRREQYRMQQMQPPRSSYSKLKKSVFGVFSC